jgi:hypothetical protein
VRGVFFRLGIEHIEAVAQSIFRNEKQLILYRFLCFALLLSPWFEHFAGIRSQDIGAVLCEIAYLWTFVLPGKANTGSCKRIDIEEETTSTRYIMCVFALGMLSVRRIQSERRKVCNLQTVTRTRVQSCLCHFHHFQVGLATFLNTPVYCGLS